ncbi:hypothetical protein CRE_25798 [Caenorhabditis remanei]|uniref:Uncharacterized protein n=1 Tax=Caenorhabditis remanei TaxID=31234 RepID=E3N5P4_CAERE|nr:hypothetical protein CRE_25798 [Caenorhabditis remanei]
MVYLHLKTSCKEVPIGDIISTGYDQFFNDLSDNCAEFRGLKTMDRYRLLYNGKALTEVDLKNINDNDSLRVVYLQKSKNKEPVAESHRQEVDSQLQMIATPFRNPEDRRLHGFNHDFGLPEHIAKLIKAHPRLVFDNQFACVLRDWYLFRAYCIRNNFKDDESRNSFKYRNPDFLKIVMGLIGKIGARYGFAVGSNQRLGQPGNAPRPAGVPAAQPITQAFLQNALQAALAGVGAPPAARAPPPVAPFLQHPAPAPAPAPAPVQPEPQQEEPMQEGYEQQAAILREYGFENAELIQLALEQTNGDIQAAMEFLIELQN